MIASLAVTCACDDDSMQQGSRMSYNYPKHHMTQAERDLHDANVIYGRDDGHDFIQHGGDVDRHKLEAQKSTSMHRPPHAF